MERAGLDRFVDVEAPQPATQLAGGIAGERERHDVSRFGVTTVDSIGDPPGEDRGLARPAAATIASGAASLSTARRWSASSPASRRSALMATRYGRAAGSGLSVSQRLEVTTVASMPFPKKNLNANETIALDMHPHWWYFAEPAVVAARQPSSSASSCWPRPTGTTSARRSRWLTIVLLVVTAVWLVIRYLKWLTTNFVITSQPADLPPGRDRQDGIEIPLERVNNVNFSQGVFERMLGAGDLLIESGGEDGQQRFTDIRRPAQVQNLIHAQMEGALPAPGRVLRGRADTGDVTEQLSGWKACCSAAPSPRKSSTRRSASCSAEPTGQPGVPGGRRPRRSARCPFAAPAASDGQRELRRQHEQRAAVGPAEHAGEAAVVGLDHVEDLAALGDAEALAARPGWPPRSRRRRRGRSRRAFAGRGRPTPDGCDSVPSSAMSNAVRRRPKLSATISVRPSGVITVPFGNIRPSAAACTEPSGSTRASVAPACAASTSASVAADLGRVEVEAEVADVGAADGVDDHVVAVERGDLPTGRRARPDDRPRGAAPRGRSSRR